MSSFWLDRATKLKLTTLASFSSSGTTNSADHGEISTRSLLHKARSSQQTSLLVSPTCEENHITTIQGHIDGPSTLKQPPHHHDHDHDPTRATPWKQLIDKKNKTRTRRTDATSYPSTAPNRSFIPFHAHLFTQKAKLDTVSL